MGDEEDNNQYLLFIIGQVTYATPLLDVREIVRPQQYKHVPNTQDYFLGVINLRGEIIGAIDTRKKLNVEKQEDPSDEVLLVFETGFGTLAALVDDVLSVRTIAEKDIERNPSVATDIEQEYLLGIAKIREKMVNLINLSSLISQAELLFNRKVA